LCRQHLKTALSLASNAQDNHLRCLVMVLITSHYLHTEEELAIDMLSTCEQLAVGMGTSENKGEKAVGNAAMRLWVGQRLLGECTHAFSRKKLRNIWPTEIYRRKGDKKKVEKQKQINSEMTKAVERIAQKGIGG
jgi:hypothetical protein